MHTEFVHCNHGDIDGARCDMLQAHISQRGPKVWKVKSQQMRLCHDCLRDPYVRAVQTHHEHRQVLQEQTHFAMCT